MLCRNAFCILKQYKPNTHVENNEKVLLDVGSTPTISTKNNKASPKTGLKPFFFLCEIDTKNNKRYNIQVKAQIYQQKR